MIAVPSNLTAFILGNGLLPEGRRRLRISDSVPDSATSAATRWEPPTAYEHLEWMRDWLVPAILRGQQLQHCADSPRTLRRQSVTVNGDTSTLPSLWCEKCDVD